MKNFLRVAALCGLVAASFSGSASAQSKSKYEVNATSIKLGFFSPGGGDARRASGTESLMFEGEIVLQHIPEQSQTTVFSVGYLDRDGLRLIPLTVSQIQHIDKATTGYDLYYGYGLGIYSARLRGLSDTSGAVKTLIGGVLTAGANLTESTFVEAKYHYPGKYDNKFIGGLQLMLGYRI